MTLTTHGPCAAVLSLQSLNYAPVAVGVVLVVAGGWWVIGARKWFDGPRKTVEDEEDFALDMKE